MQIYFNSELQRDVNYNNQGVYNFPQMAEARRHSCVFVAPDDDPNANGECCLNVGAVSPSSSCTSLLMPTDMCPQKRSRKLVRNGDVVLKTIFSERTNS
jgi:hypothetical protein